LTTRDTTKQKTKISKRRSGQTQDQENYEELLGIRIEKLRGRILNREKINKSIDEFISSALNAKSVTISTRAGSRRQEPEQLCGTCAKIKGIRSSA
jgi:hypothetical protein